MTQDSKTWAQRIFDGVGCMHSGVLDVDDDHDENECTCCAAIKADIQKHVEAISKESQEGKAVDTTKGQEKAQQIEFWRAVAWEAYEAATSLPVDGRPDFPKPGDDVDAFGAALAEYGDKQEAHLLAEKDKRIKEQEQTITLLQVGKYGTHHLAEQNLSKDERIAKLEGLLQEAAEKHFTCDASYRLRKDCNCIKCRIKRSVPKTTPQSLPVTDPELDAPDGATVDGYERHGRTWEKVPEPKTRPSDEHCPKCKKWRPKPGTLAGINPNAVCSCPS